MHNLSLEQANELLSKVGVDAKVVADNADTDVDIDAISASVYENIPADVKTAIEDAAKGAATGKSMGSFRSAAGKRFGLTSSELKDKSYEEILDLIKANSTKSDKETDYEARLEALRTDYETQLAEKETEWQTKETEYTTQVAEANKKFDDRDINGHIRSYLEKMPRTGGNIDRQTSAVRSELERDGFTPKKNAKGEVEWWKGDKLTKADDIYKTIASDIIPIAKDTSHLRPSDVNKLDRLPGIQHDKPNMELSDLDQERARVREWANSEG